MAKKLAKYLKDYVSCGKEIIDNMRIESLIRCGHTFWLKFLFEAIKRKVLNVIRVVPLMYKILIKIYCELKI